MLVLSGGDIETLVDDLQQVSVLQSGGDPLLVGQLLVDGGLASVAPGRYRHPHLEPLRQRPQQLHPYSQTWIRADILLIAGQNYFN